MGFDQLGGTGAGGVSMRKQETDIVVVGAGNIGVSVAYHVKAMAPTKHVVLLDRGQPLSFTSAQSGENYRNWWPHPVMKRFMDRSIELMEGLAAETDNRIAMTRRGYALATRQANIEAYLGELQECYDETPERGLRFHGEAREPRYEESVTSDQAGAMEGVDIVTHSGLVQRVFPWLDREVRTVIHIRRGGDISGQQLGQIMLERFRELGGARETAEVVNIASNGRFALDLRDGSTITSEVLVNAAGPFVNAIAGMLNLELPIRNVVQQKLAFEDSRGAISRRMPFTIDLDPQFLDWDEEERDLLLQDPRMARFAGEMPGAIHCRPDGGEKGTWIKLGWAFNEEPTEASFEPNFDDSFPEIVLRGAARLHPKLKAYYGRLPRGAVHYGGFYTMTEENWPLIGPMGMDGAFLAGAMSGFGTMAACAAGELCAKWVLGRPLPDHAGALSLQRHDDRALMDDLTDRANKGLL